MSLDNIKRRLNFMKATGVEIKNALDIGAYRGEFTKVLKEIWPDVEVQQFEADERQTHYLQPDAVMKPLSDRVKMVDFYTIPDTHHGSTTGSSIYLENTEFYKDKIVTQKMTATLDDHVHIDGEWADHGLVKLDVQGSEIDVLIGGDYFMRHCKPRYVLTEVSVMPYNQGAPLAAQVIAHLHRLGYRLFDVADMKYEDHGFLLQMDLMFKRP